MLFDKAYDFASLVQKINTACFGLQALSNDELRLKTRLTVREINLQEKRIAALDEALVTVFAIVKETARRFAENEETIVTATDFDRELAANPANDFITIDGDKETRKAVNILVQSNSISDALEALKLNLKSYDCNIIGIKLSTIIEIVNITPTESAE